ncbi:MAG: FtsX-like permease family protein, partial [Vicinamibacterales bacterium]
MATGCLVVLISCANAANLMLARSARRARELAIRTSIGASRRRVMRQLLIEGAVLAALGGLAGLGVAVAGVRLFSAAIPDQVLPYWFDYSVDVRVLAALIGVSAASVFLFALLPALQASKSDVTLVLKDGGRTSTGRGLRWTTAFLALEYGLAVVLLAHFVVNVRTAAPALATDRALDTDRVLAAAITLPSESLPTPAHRQAFFDALQARLGGLPAVSAAAIADVLPLSGGEEKRVDVEGRARTADDARAVRAVAITPGYFETLGLTVLRGRDLELMDGETGRSHVVVNERFVEQFLGHEEPIGRRISLVDPNAPESDRPWSTIVGVVPSVRQRPGPTPDPVIYIPFRAIAPANAHLLVRSDLDSAALASLLREEMAVLDRSLPLYRVRTLARVSRDAQWNGRVSSRLFVTLTLIAVILATIGLYAVTAHSVLQRTQEIGVRMALGARQRQIVQLIARRVALQLGAGLLAGVAGSKVWGWAFGSGRDEVSTTDPTSILAVAAILTLLAASACFVPARRAARLDPVAAIRHD